MSDIIFIPSLEMKINEKLVGIKARNTIEAKRMYW